MRLVTEKNPPPDELRHVYAISGLVVAGERYRAVCGYWVEATKNSFAGDPPGGVRVCLICFKYKHMYLWRHFPESTPPFEHPLAVLPKVSGGV